MAEDLTSAVRARELTRAFGSFARARALFRGVSLSRERDIRRRWARERVFERGVSIDRSRGGGGARGIGSDGSDGADVFDGSAVTSRARGMVD